MKIMKTLVAGVVAGAMMLSSPLALAHAKLTHSKPPAGASIGEVPSQLTLTFSAPLHLTYVALAPTSGEVIKLEIPSKRANAVHALPLPVLLPAVYTVEWRALSSDGHIMNGSWQFTMAGN